MQDAMKSSARLLILCRGKTAYMTVYLASNTRKYKQTSKKLRKVVQNTGPSFRFSEGSGHEITLYCRKSALAQEIRLEACMDKYTGTERRLELPVILSSQWIKVFLRRAWRKV